MTGVLLVITVLGSIVGIGVAADFSSKAIQFIDNRNNKKANVILIFINPPSKIKQSLTNFLFYNDNVNSARLKNQKTSTLSAVLFSADFNSYQLIFFHPIDQLCVMRI